MAIKKKVKTNKHNTNSIKQAKNALQEYHLNMFTFRQKPVNDQFLENIAKELVDWAMNNDDALVLSEFFTLNGICNRDLSRWRKRNEKLDAAYDFAKMVIGNRRERGALTNKFNVGIVFRSMAMYSERWKDLEEWRVGLKQKEKAAEQKTVYIVMDKVEETGIVPPLKKEEHEHSFSETKVIQ